MSKERSVLSLFFSIVDDAESLIRDHVRLVKEETSEETERVKVTVKLVFMLAAVMMGVGQAVVLAVGFAMYDLTGLPLSLSFLLALTVIAFLGGVTYFLVGKKMGRPRVKLPETAQTLKEDALWLINGMSPQPITLKKSGPPSTELVLQSDKK